jgi:RNA polymerase sigma-70 factor (ECF subfamily)
LKTSCTIKERFTELFQANKNKVYDYALKMLNDRDCAEDISQEAFIRLYNNLKGNTQINNPQNWLFIITRNLCLNKLRDTKRPVTYDSAGHSEALITNNLNPKHIQLQRALNNLENKYREVLILKEYEGFSYDEISKILNTTVPAIRALLYKARVQLKNNYERLMPGGDHNVL